ncbi:MAG: ferrous iron transport protein A [Candidatus Saganbacteria bacterium]|nr:ferrous iron transport protein A [Candidatus Saganbacteria bacterium]
MESEKALLPVTQLKEGESGTIWEIAGGLNAVRRLEALGIRQGKSLKKLGGMYLRGPVVVQVGHTKISIGHGMASKIVVEVRR